jgi:hypothetical protein
MSDTAGFSDPYAQPGAAGTLTDMRPQGYRIEFGEDGRASAIGPEDSQEQRPQLDHFVNLATVLEDGELNRIVTDLLDAIEDDKEAGEERDRQYQEGLNRTGMGSNIPGGANFPGASRAMHPLLLEASLDFGGSMMNAMLPPEGPCKAQTQGDESQQKDDKAKRTTRWINYQFTEKMASAYNQFEIGFTQCPLGGAFYTKTYVDENGEPQIAFIPVDHVYRPFNDGDFYSQPRITHHDWVDKWTYEANIDSGLWCDAGVDFDAAGGELPEQTKTDQATNRVTGHSETPRNVDGLRPVYETSAILKTSLDEHNTPYLVTIDVKARKCVALYRNWREADETQQRCVFLIEWGFWPWRGGAPVGLSHMIGSLSGAASGALRALLDAGMLNNSQTGTKLKGGSTAGSQNINPRVGEITEIQGSLAQDDIRKAFMPMNFNPPSETLLKLLGFLVDAGRGVVRSTYDDMEKFGANTPVGTTQMFLEQGLRNVTSIHGRMHRAMRMQLKVLWQINADTLTDQTVIDEQGELTVSAADFKGPMNVIPVSDPRLWSDLQRKALAQTIVTRASDPVIGQLYNTRATETYFLRQMGAPDPDAFLKPNPQPKQTNAVAENVLASSGQPVKAFPGQDHEAHIKLHLAYLNSPYFGSNPSIAMKFIPLMIEHMGEHLSLWYSDAMLDAATAAIRKITGNNLITLESFTGMGTEVPLDRLMDQLDDEVLMLAEEELKEIPEAIEHARELMKELAPPMPMDPSVVAMEDVQRQRKKDSEDTKVKLVDLDQKRAERDAKVRESEAKIEAEREKRMQEARQAALDLEAEREQAQRDLLNDAADREAEDERNRRDNETRIEIADKNNEARLEAAKKQAEAAKARASQRPKPGSSSAGTRK